MRKGGSNPQECNLTTPQGSASAIPPSPWGDSLSSLFHVDFFGLFEQFWSPWLGLYQLSYITPNQGIQNLPKILKSDEPKFVDCL